MLFWSILSSDIRKHRKYSMNIHEKDTKRYKFLAKSEGWISVFVNILLFLFKFWVGYISGSVAIVADAWHSLSDSMT
ncbi:MAG: cation transporter, partial [Victivallaceae bacterium]|nr:cation transporter [Victivallaceae bacterium]